MLYKFFLHSYANKLCMIIKNKSLFKMLNFQSEKRIVREYYSALDRADENDLANVIISYTNKNYIWRGFYPFEIQKNIGTLVKSFWLPFRQSLSHLQRRTDIFFAGLNFIDNGGSVWVCSMGHLMGLFDNPWLNIEPTNKIAMLRYAEFHKIENQKISETAFYFDIPHLMIQAGYQPFKSQTATNLIQPGPAPNTGLLYDVNDPKESQLTMDIMNSMIQDVGTWQSELTLEEELARTWHKDMIWWGPAGIGSTYTIPRYAKQHAKPFRTGLSGKVTTGHICRIAEGHYSGFFGWPNFTAKPNGYLGLPRSNINCEFRVIDVYRREGNKLKENWVFIDMLHFFKQQGIDILENSK